MKSISLVMVLLMALVLPAHILAGDSSAILGTEDWFAGDLPPPGFHFINYLAYYHSDKLKDEDGHTNFDVDFDVKMVADVLRGIYVSDMKVLGGDLGWHVIVPIVYQDVEVKLPAPWGFDEDHFAIGDIYFSPCILGWHSEIFHCVAGLDIIAPTGQYDKDDRAPIGVNHWTFEPALAISMIHPSGLSASVKLMYDIHTKNTDWINPDTGTTADLLTGQQFHLDYNVGYQVMDGLRLGVCGYYLKGLEDDEIDGEGALDSKEQVFAVGPSAMYSFSKQLSIIAKAQFEMEAENLSEGTLAWLKVLYSF